MTHSSAPLPPTEGPLSAESATPSAAQPGPQAETTPLANPPEAEAASKALDAPSGEAASLINVALQELQSRRQDLRVEISGLEQQRDRLVQEIGANPLGQSELIARRVKGFQAYLVGALQELAAAAEQAELVAAPLQVQPSPLDQVAPPPAPPPAAAGLFEEIGRAHV